ncbi:MAG: hypothetical protein HYV60_01305 [Planctomycetia bacterium]|nr:hypothetical protein [Planctomycetia bacterium]
MAHTTRANSKSKRVDKFPLSLHKPTGQYRKRIRGRDVYFGTDPDKALAEWLRVKDDLLAGRTPKPFDGDACDLKTLCNSFLTNALAKRDGGELTTRSFDDYHKSCERMLKHLGIRVILRYAFENGLTDKPVRFGDFKRPAKRVTRREKAQAGSKLFAPADIRKLIESADAQMKAMILLGVNCGFGNGDCGQLPMEAIDLDGGWLDFPRPKTGIGRRCPLWPETIQAMRDYLPTRKTPTDADNAGQLFVTRCGGSWFIDKARCPLSAEFRKLCQLAEVYEANRGFYGRSAAACCGRSRARLAVRRCGNGRRGPEQ